MLEMRASYFFFQFPDKLDVHRRSLLHRVSRAKKRRQGWTLIIGGTSPNIAISVFMKYERRPQPLRFIRRLNVEVVIDRYRWPVSTIDKPSYDDGISRCLHPFRV